MSAPSAWRCERAHIGGGGYITGLVQNPKKSSVLYARCDVGGVFVSRDAGRSWCPQNHGMTDAHHHNVHSLAVHPHHPNLLLRASGDARGGERFGTLHLSRDGGEYWHTVSDDLDFFGNGPTRMMGEVIAWDPHDTLHALAAGYSAGLWRSHDGGVSWLPIGLQGERFTTLVFDPHIAGRVFAGSTGDAVLGIIEQGERWAHETIKAKCQRYSDMPRGDRGRLYRSLDGGSSWAVVLEGVDVAHLAFSPTFENMLFAATLRDGLLRSTDGGGRWHSIAGGLPERCPFHTVTVTKNGVLFTAPDVRPRHTDLPPVPVYRSTDCGDSWCLVHHHTSGDLRNYPSYMGVRHAGWAISTLLADVANEERLYMSNWFGVARSDDGGYTWDAHGFRGIETTCAEAIVSDPRTPGTVYLSLADHYPMVSHDGGRSYCPIAVQLMSKDTAASDSTAILASRHQAGLVIAGLTRRGAAVRPASVLCSHDGGRTAQQLGPFPNRLFVQALAEDPHQPGRIYAFLDGTLADGAGVYCSGNWGESWKRLPLQFPPYIQKFPHQTNLIEAELLPVVGYQVKNGCGTGGRLCVDPHYPDRMYLGEWTEGLYCIENESRVTRIGQELPFGLHRTSVLTTLRADEYYPGVLYAGFVREGLWQSYDAGMTWRKIYPSSRRVFNATAFASAGDVLVVACEPLRASPCYSKVMMSKDGGDNWEELYHGEFGALRWKGITLDSATGDVCGATCGNGCFVFLT